MYLSGSLVEPGVLKAPSRLSRCCKTRRSRAYEALLRLVHLLFHFSIYIFGFVREAFVPRNKILTSRPFLWNGTAFLTLIPGFNVLSKFLQEPSITIRAPFL